MSLMRTRWAAIGAAVAVSLGAGGIGLSQAAINSGQKPVFVAITPCRLVDTRPGDGNIGGRTVPLGANDTLELQVTGSTGECTGIPGDAVAAALNVTAIRPTAQSYFSIYPADAPLPNASNLNWAAGDPPTPNKVDTDLSADGKIKITNSVGQVHVAADLVGYYTDHTHDDRYYTKNQTKEQIAAALAGKTDAGSVYTKAQTDTALAGKADTGHLHDERYYTESESDARYYTRTDADARYLQPGQAASPPTTQARWAGCNGPSMNTPDDEDNTFAITNNTRGYIGSSTTGTEFFCDLDLPNGARMTGFRALLRDIGPSGSGQGLARCFLYGMPLTGPNAGLEDNLGNTVAGTGLLGTNGVETPLLVDDPMPVLTVDTENNVYFIKCDVFSGGSTTPGQLGIYAAQVRYQVTAVPGTND